MADSLRALPDIARLPGLADALLGDLPVWLWDVEDGRIVFANAAGVAFFGEPTLSALTARHFDMARPGLRQLRAMAEALPQDGAPRLAMLRFFVGLKDRAAACMCRAVEVGGVPAVLVAATAGAPDRRTVAERCAVLFDDADAGVRLRGEDGEVYRNAAADGEASAETAGIELSTPRGVFTLSIDLPEPVADAAPAGETAGSAPSAPPRPALPSRFSFVLDAEGRFVDVGPALAAAVGATRSDIAGRFWADVARELDLDPQGRVASALLRRDTWSGIEVAWPAEDGGAVRVRLAALPAFGDGRVFAGFRGFGDILGEAEVPQKSAAEPALVEGREQDVVFAEPETPPAVVADEENPDVVRLQPSRPVPDQGPALSDRERNAFSAIAEALGARWEGDERLAETTEEDEADEGWTEGETALEPTAAATPAVHEDVPAEETHDAVTRVLDRLPVGIAVLRDERIIYVNRAFLDVFDYTDLDDLEIAGGVAALFEGRSAGEARAGAAIGRRRDGSQMTVDSRIGRLPWIDGPAMFVTAREIDETVAETQAADEGAEETVAATSVEADELRAILDIAADGVIVLSTDGIIESMNRSAEALFGQDFATMAGRPFADLLSDASRAAVADYLEGLISGGVRSVLNDGREIVARADRGGELPLFLTIGPLGEGDAARFCAVVRDLTDWKAAEAELVAARKRAESASSQKSDFLAKMSHEIRTPLNAIIGFAEVILEERFGAVGNDRYKEYIKDIRESGEHIMSLVNDLLDLSKIEAGKLELSFTGVNLNDIVEQTVAIMQPQANRDRVIIRTSLARRMPPVVADARSLRQVMLNLLSNGIKFTPPGGQVIVSTLQSDEGEVLLRVRDTGVGMSEADIQVAMEPFRQLSVRPDGRQKGTGLGLPLTRALVEANRASFAIRSQPKEGTLVEVSFPQARVLAE